MNMNKKNFQRAKVHTALTPGEALKMLRELQGLGECHLNCVCAKISLVYLAGESPAAEENRSHCIASLASSEVTKMTKRRQRNYRAKTAR